MMRIAPFWTLLFLTALLLSLPATAQPWDSTDTGIYYDGGGVGIGPEAPVEDLHVDATSGHNTIRLGRASYLQESDGKRRLFLGANVYDDETGSWSRQSSTHGAVAVDLVADEGDWGSFLSFRVDARETDFPTERMRITSTGNVGIGTKTPLDFDDNRGLHLDRGGHTSLVLGDGTNDGGVIQSSDDIRRLFLGVNVYDGIQNSRWDRFEAHGAAGIDVIADEGADENMVRFLVDESGSGFPAERMRITETGAVGIGTDEPSKRLEVNGQIRTKEVIVETKNWPDYVFDESYDLRTPAELAAFIAREGHLPALPSAETVEAEGQTVGEVQRGLVKTVEELARYAIDQEQRAERRDARTDSLARDVRRLRRRDRAREERLEALERQNEQLQQQIDRLRHLLRAGEDE